MDSMIELRNKLIIKWYKEGRTVEEISVQLRTVSPELALSTTLIKQIVRGVE